MQSYSPYESVSELLALRADRTPDGLAVDVCGERRTYADLWERAGRVQGWLTQAGVRSGQPVALMMRNRIEFVEAFAAVSRAGAIAVPINTATVGDALRYTLDHSEAVGILVDAELLPALEALGELKHLRWVVVVGEGAGPHTEYGELIAASPLAPREVAGSDTLGIIYTSGTTGPPKGVMLSHTSYVNTGGYFSKHLGLTADDVLHTCLPLFHCNAQQTSLMAGLHLGAPVHVDPKFSLSNFWSWIERSEATVSNLLGTMLVLLSKLPDDAADRVHTLRYILAAPVPEELHRPLEARLGVRIVEGYGLTETGTMAIINPPRDTRSGTIGLPLEHVEGKVVDPAGAEVPDETPGEIAVRTRIRGAFMTGYYKEPGKSAEVMADGWFRTGDLGHRRSDGYFVFRDRMKDTIRRRGENISSYFVEKALTDHPDVMEAAAVGVPSDLSEEDVKVLVRLRPGADLTPEAVYSWCEKTLADFMRPRYLEFVDDFPRTETGRIHKFVLRDAGIGTAWDRDAAPIKENARD